MEQSLFELFKGILKAHIETKTNEPLFHEKSVEFYELLFDCFHLISEKNQDIGVDEPMDCKDAIQLAYDNLNEAKLIVGDMIGEKPTIGMDNLLRGLYDRLEGACGNARAFLKEEYEEVDNTDKKEIEKPKMGIKIPR